MDANYKEWSDNVITGTTTPGHAGRPAKAGRVLVPLDGSGFAETVIPHAISLAAALHGKLRLVRVSPPLPLIEPVGIGFTPSPPVWDLWAEQPALARRYLGGIEDILNKRGLGADSTVLEGDPARSLVEYAKGHPEVAMIAMSTHGRSGISRWVMGSVAERVLHSSPVPLLLVRADDAGTRAGGAALFPEHSYRTILVPLDGSEFGEHALEEAQDLAIRLHATLRLVSVVPPLETWVAVAEASTPFLMEKAEEEQTESMTLYLQAIAERLRAKGLEVEQEVAHGEPAEQILRRSESGADLIIMSSHGRSGLPRLWLGSVAMKVVDASSIPVLVVRAAEPQARTENTVQRLEEIPVPA